MVSKRPAMKLAGKAATPPPQKKARQAGKASTPSTPKRQRQDPVASLCQAVAKGIQAAEEAPSVVQEMLVAMLETSLTVCKDERHRFQEGTVDMVGGLFSSMEAGILKKIEDSEAQVAGGDEEKGKREAAIKDAEEKVAAQKEEVMAKKDVLADHAQDFRNAKEAAAEAQTAQAKSSKELAAAARRKDQLEAAMRDLARPLIEGTCKEKEQEFVDNLMPILHSLGGLSDSLTAPLPSMLLKEPGKRGSFDTMLAVQLEEEVGKRLAEFSTVMKDAEAAKASHGAAHEAAEAKLAAAREAQRSSAKAFTDAQSEQQEREKELKTAQQALKELGPQMRQNAKMVERAKDSLAKFREGPLAAFTELRDRTVPPPAVEEVAPAAVEGQAEPEAEAEVAQAA